jgi:hypothetical protein
MIRMQQLCSWCKTSIASSLNRHPLPAIASLSFTCNFGEMLKIPKRSLACTRHNSAPQRIPAPGITHRVRRYSDTVARTRQDAREGVD